MATRPRRFFAELERVRLRRGSAKVIGSPDLPGVAAVAVERASALPEHGLKMTWKTMSIGAA